MAQHLDFHGHCSHLLTSTPSELEHGNSLHFLNAFKTVRRLNSPVPGNCKDHSRLVGEILVYVQALCERSKLIIDSYDLRTKDIIALAQDASVILFEDEYKRDKDNLSTNGMTSQVFFVPELSFTCNPCQIAGLDLMPLFPPFLELKCPVDYSENNLLRHIFLAPGAAGRKPLMKFIDIILRSPDCSRFVLFTYDSFLGNFPNVTLIDGSSGILPYLAFADFVVTAAGNTMLESIFLATPTIAFATHSNQKAVFDALHSMHQVLTMTEGLDYLKTFSHSCKRRRKDINRKMHFSYDRLLEFITQ